MRLADDDQIERLTLERSSVRRDGSQRRVEFFDTDDVLLGDEEKTFNVQQVGRSKQRRTSHRHGGRTMTIKSEERATTIMCTRSNAIRLEKLQCADVI